MHKSALAVLVDPVSKNSLQLEEQVASNGEIERGVLRNSQGQEYPIRNGIPRFVDTEDAGQRQTQASFGFKWNRQESYENEQFANTYHDWLIGKYGFSNAQDMRDFFAGRQRILEAGCGSGLSASMWLDDSWQGDSKPQWFGVDISNAVDIAAQRLGSFPGTNFLQADILNLPFAANSFDTIFSEGVLHHTPSTERALKSLAALLTPNGEIMFYVYRKKGPVREFTDDYVRSVLSPLPPEAAWEMLRPLTRLAQSLSELNVEVDVPEDIPYLGIKAGRQDVQRLIYWHFAKLFWNEDFGFEGSNHVNFDWYHPRYAHRQTESDIRRWCEEVSLDVTYLDEQESGFTVRAIKT